VKIQTLHFGEIDAKEEQILRFVTEIPGLTGLTRYILIPYKSDADNPFFYLQAVEDPAIRLLVVVPFAFVPNYSIQIPEYVTEALHIQSTDEVAIVTVVVPNDPIIESTTNLKAPILINTREKLAVQHIFDSPEYDMRYKLFQTLQGAKG
jgi:flagellar assembly factor FliW